MTEILPPESYASQVFEPGKRQNIAIPIPRPRSSQLDLDAFSPVNQNGSFEYDRVLKSGEVFKRTKKTKQWKSFYLVLRPNLLSIYKSPSEDRLQKQINLSDLTAVTYLKDPKRQRKYTFGLFSPSKNFRLQAKDEKDAQAWVELIKQEARIDQEEQEIQLGSSAAAEPRFDQKLSYANRYDSWDEERLGSSSPEPLEFPPRRSATKDGVVIPGIRKTSIYETEYSGDDFGLHSDFSDVSLSRNSGINATVQRMRTDLKPSMPATENVPPIPRPGTARNRSQQSILNIDQEEERVMWHGYLLCLKTKGGVRQWKKHWAVMRPKHLAFYKSEEEYVAHRIIPLSTIISAVEIDSVSKSKPYCFQIITEEKNCRFCASSEEALTWCLGALKSQLARRKEAGGKNPAPST